MNISIAGRPDVFRCLEINIAATLTAIGLMACSGSGGSSGGGSGGAQDPVGPGDPGVCTAEEIATRLETGPCPEGLICVGEVYGSTIANTMPLTGGSRPDWSPDGQKITFQRMPTPAYRSGGIFVINIDGSGEVMLAEGQEPAWSPVGGRIVFRNDDGIAVMADDGTSVVTLIHHTFANDGSVGVGAPAWSPDGQRIAFVNYGDGDVTPSQLFVVNADGSDPRRLTPASSADQRAEIDPAWSPDGGTIALVSYPDLATVDATGGKASVIVSLADRTASRPDWSPDGSMMTYAEQSPCAADTIRMVSSSGGATEVLVEGARDAVWSSDGSRLAFASATGVFPPVSGVASVYVQENPDSLGLRSRYVLFEDRTFELQYVSSKRGFSSYTGQYTRDDTIFSFNFDGGSTAKPWSATGKLNGLRLSVE